MSETKLQLTNARYLPIYPKNRTDTLVQGSWRWCLNPLLQGTQKQTLPYCCWFRNPANQLRLVVSSTIYGVVYIPRGFSEFWTTKSRNPKKSIISQSNLPVSVGSPDPIRGSYARSRRNWWPWMSSPNILRIWGTFFIHFITSSNLQGIIFVEKSENHLTKWSWTKTRHTSCKFKLDIEIKWVWWDLYCTLHISSLRPQKKQQQEDHIVFWNQHSRFHFGKPIPSHHKMPLFKGSTTHTHTLILFVALGKLQKVKHNSPSRTPWNWLIL